MSNQSSTDGISLFLGPKKKDISLFLGPKTDTIDVRNQLPPLKQAPDFGEGAPFLNSQEGQDLITKGLNDPESLTQGERSRFNSAVEAFPQLKEIIDQQQEVQIPPAHQKRVESMVQLYDETLMEFAKNAGDPFIPEFTKRLDQFISGVGELLSPERIVQETAKLIGIEIDTRTMTDITTEFFARHDLEEVKPGDEYLALPEDAKNMFDKDFTGEPVVVKHTATSAFATNFAKGAIRLTPELIVQFSENPYEFMKGIVVFPYHTIKTILDAAGGVRSPVFGGGMLYQPTYEDVQKARDELIANPIQIPMLGLMFAGIGGKVAKFASRRSVLVDAKILEKKLVEIDKLVEEQRIQKETTQAAQKAAKEKKLSVEDIDIQKAKIAEKKAVVQELSRSELVIEANRLQESKVNAAERIPPSELVKMNRGQLENIVAGEKVADVTPKINELSKQREKVTDLESQIAEQKSVLEPLQNQFKEISKKKLDKDGQAEKTKIKSERDAERTKLEDIESQLKVEQEKLAPLERQESVGATKTPETQEQISLPPKAVETKPVSPPLKTAKEVGLEKAEAITKAEHDRAQKKKEKIEDNLESLERSMADIEESLSGGGIDKGNTQILEVMAANQRAHILRDKAILAEVDEILSRPVKPDPVKPKEPVKPSESPKELDIKTEKIPETKVEPKAVDEPIALKEPETKVEPKAVEKPDVIDTGNKPADAARNLAHTKRFIKSLEERLGEDGLKPEQRKAFTDQLVEAKKEETVHQATFDKVQDKLEQDLATQLEVKKDIPGEFTSKIMKLDDVFVEPKRFQNREAEFSEASVQRIVDNFDATKFDPVIVWKDPKGGTYLLSGHSRFEAMQRLNKTDIPVREFKGTEAEAIHFAKVEANRLQTKETVQEDIKAYKLAKDKGNTQKELGNTFGTENVKNLDAWSQLDSKGIFLETLTNPAADSFPYIKRWARNVGELRKTFPELTNVHEKQMFDAIYRDPGLVDMSKADFQDMIQKQVSDALFDPKQPLKFKRGQVFETGARARKDTGVIMKQIDDLIKQRDAAITVAEREAIEVKIQKKRDSIKELIKSQGSLFSDGSVELGSFGTPRDMINLGETIYGGFKGLTKYAKDVREASKLPPEVKAGQTAGLDAMTGNRLRVRDAELQRLLASNQLKDAIPDISRWEPIIHAWEQGPTSLHWNKLNTFEQGVATWLRNESAKWEKFAIDNGLIDAPKDRAPGQAHVFHHWLGKDGKPLPAEFGRFAKTSPVLLKRKHPTFEAGQEAGLTIATKNPGTLLGHTIVNLVKTFEARELYKNLNNITYSSDFPITIAGKERALKMVENWRDLQKEGLTDGYIRVDDRFLDRPIRYRDNAGHTRVIDGPVGVREEIHPWYDAYTNSPTFNKFDKLNQATKGIVLSGFFHPMQLGMQEVRTGRLPFVNIPRGLRLAKRPNEVVGGLIKHGLDVEGFREFGRNYTDALTLEGSGPVIKVGNAVLSIPRAIAKFTFDVVHPGIKTSWAHDKFIQIWPEYERQGFSKDVAYRDVVKQADRLFSGQDYRLTLLESSKSAINYWYGVTARQAWQRALLSQTWQESHFLDFAATTKSLTPKALIELVGKEPNRPIAKSYRRSLAGALGLYSAANVYNWVATKDMDGESKTMWQNPDGKGYRVRALYNDPDGTPVYIMPFKSIFEVPEAISAVVKGEFGKFVSKLTPLIGQNIKFFWNLNKYGQTNDPDMTLAEIAKNYALGYAPISITNIFKYMEENRAGIGAAISNLGFPVSRGTRGGEWAKKLKDWQRKEYQSDKEARKAARNKILEGKVTEGLLILYDRGLSDKSGENLLLDMMVPLTNIWTKMSEVDQAIFLNAIGQDEATKLLKAVGSEKTLDIKEKTK